MGSGDFGTRLSRDPLARAKHPSQFILTEDDFKTTILDKSDDQPTISTSPNKHKNKSKEQLLFNVTTGFKTILLSAPKKKGNTKKLKVGEVSGLQSVSDTVSSLVAFVNKASSTKFHSFEDMHDHFQQEVQVTP